jgi:hypothetical protein
MAVAKRRAIDQIRRNERFERKLGELGHELVIDGDTTTPDMDAAFDDHIEDDLLRLVFVSCHPVLAAESRVALTLRLLGGLTTDEIASAYLVPESTVAQRIVRAKRTLAKAGVPFEVPERAERAARLSSVLEVVYLVFNEGYVATAGADWVRPALCEDALRLGRILAELAAKEPEVHGLVALMEIQASRTGRGPGPRVSRCCFSTRIAGAGTGCRSGADWPPWSASRRSTPTVARTRCRPRSRAATRWPGHPRTPDTRGHRLGAHRSALRGPRPEDTVC